MKKWLITYLFIVYTLSCHLCSFGNPLKAGYAGNVLPGYTTSHLNFSFKKAILSLYDYTDDKDACIFFHLQSIRISHSVVYNYKAEQNFFLSVPCHVPGEAMNTKEVERVLKDHLVHLYPSHYFW